MVGGRNGNNQKEFRCYYDWGGGLVKVNEFHCRSTMSAMARKILVDVVTYIFDIWGQNGSEDAGCA